MHHSLQAERRKPPQQGYASNLLGEQPAWRRHHVGGRQQRAHPEGLHVMGRLRPSARRGHVEARRRRNPDGASLPHRHARRSQARVLPPLRREGQLRAYAPDAHQRRCRVHAQWHALRPRNRRQHLRQHGFREIGTRSSEEDVRRFPLRQACGARDRELDAGVALPAHGEGRARAHVRALGRRRRHPLLQRELPSALRLRAHALRRDRLRCLDGVRRV